MQSYYRLELADLNDQLDRAMIDPGGDPRTVQYLLQARNAVEDNLFNLNKAKGGGGGGGPSAAERAQALAIQEAGVTGMYNGEPTLAAQGQQAQQEAAAQAHRDTFARMVAEAQTSLQAAKSQEAKRMSDLAPFTLAPGAQWLPGHEPGGMASRVYGNLGLPFTPAGADQAIPIQPTDLSEYEKRLAAAMAGANGG